MAVALESRIGKSIRNAQVNVFFYIVSLFLAFFSRRIFLEHLGIEFLGLSSTLGDILNLMNISELGIGTATCVTLYKPLFENNRNQVNDIISVLGFLYSRIGLLIGGAGIILSCFFPLFFNHSEVSLWLVYFMFYIMLYGALLGYFANYHQIILIATQNNYVLVFRYQTINAIKISVQIACSFLPYCYIWWLLLELVGSTVNSIFLRYSVRKRFPWVQTSIKLGKSKFKDYGDLWKKTKQVFAFKLSHLIFNGSINILISALISISTVALYGNYNMLINKVASFFDGLFTGMGASIGNLIAEGDEKKIFKIFYELMSIRYFIAGLCSITMYFITPKLIIMWIGEQYLLPNIILVLFSVHTFILQARLSISNFKDAYGLFQDVWAPISEVVLAVVGAVILGKIYGLSGILVSFVATDFLIKFCWQPYFLFKEGFKVSILKTYIPLFLKYILLLALIYFICLYIDNYYNHIFNTQSISGMIFYCLIMGTSVVISLSILFICFDKHFRCFLRHMKDFREHNS